jgi:hypothetical protein
MDRGEGGKKTNPTIEAPASTAQSTVLEVLRPHIFDKVFMEELFQVLWFISIGYLLPFVRRSIFPDLITY